MESVSDSSESGWAVRWGHVREGRRKHAGDLGERNMGGIKKGIVPESVSQSSSSWGPSCVRMNSSSMTSSSLTILADYAVSVVNGCFEDSALFCGVD